MQLLKFGRLVDLEKLETVSVNRAAEELKEQLRSQEFSNAKEIAAWEVRISFISMVFLKTGSLIIPQLNSHKDSLCT